LAALSLPLLLLLLQLPKVLTILLLLLLLLSPVMVQMAVYLAWTAAVASDMVRAWLVRLGMQTVAGCGGNRTDVVWAQAGLQYVVHDLCSMVGDQ
jgi:hypothetical protein